MNKLSKLGCPCGHVISDVAFPVEYDEGHLLCDEDRDLYIGVVAAKLAEFTAAIRDGKRDEWILQEWDWCEDPTDVIKDSDEEIIKNILGILYSYTRVVSQCEKCGRLHVQKKPGGSFYYPFKPDAGPGWEEVVKDVMPPSPFDFTAADTCSTQ